MEDYTNDDVKRVMSKLLLRMQEPENPSPVHSSTPNMKRKVNITDPNPFINESDLTPVKSAKSIKPKDFASTTLARMEGIKQKNIEKIKNLEESKKQKEVAELKKKPVINKHSQKIGKRNHPIYDRVEEELKESNSKLKTVREKLEKERTDKIKGELTFKPKLFKPNKAPKRSNEEFYKYNQEWIERKAKKSDKKRDEIEQKINEQLKFTPELDTNSKNIVGSLGARGPIENRLLEKHEFVKKRIQTERDEQAFSFTPLIEEKSRLIAKHKIEGDVFSRLFDLSKEKNDEILSPKFELNRNRSFSFSNDYEEKSQKKIDFLFDLS